MPAPVAAVAENAGANGKLMGRGGQRGDAAAAAGVNGNISRMEEGREGEGLQFSEGKGSKGWKGSDAEGGRSERWLIKTEKVRMEENDDAASAAVAIHPVNDGHLAIRNGSKF
eukprot:TRINITY_DN6022_c0_g1_i1.p1 TRINITY_DN6022_c0_g1~~TRINITY_DN6022_c0_g1_i1.p1  ORF type:complete len:123 (+),score=39.49 TRINITY_DN6022_c0_g1_i1:31-369(+)